MSQYTTDQLEYLEQARTANPLITRILCLCEANIAVASIATLLLTSSTVVKQNQRWLMDAGFKLGNQS